MSNEEMAEIQEETVEIIEESDEEVGDQEPDTEPEDESDDEGEIVVTLGEDSPPQEEDDQHAPEWVREVRKQNRELKKQKRELEEKLKVVAGVEMKEAPVGSAPTLMDCDYDEDLFREKTIQWQKAKDAEDARNAKEKEEADAANAEWAKRHQVYEESKKTQRVKDFEDKEDAVKSALSVTQQGILIRVASDPYKMVAALGGNPTELSLLSKITDPLLYTAHIVRMEQKMKVTSKKAPPPERKVPSGGGPLAQSGDAVLDRLRKEAEKTGDISKVIAYKKQHKKE